MALITLSTCDDMGALATCPPGSPFVVTWDEGYGAARRCAKWADLFVWMPPECSELRISAYGHSNGSPRQVALPHRYA